MAIETLDDILDGLADQLGIYGAHPEDMDEECECRCCWIAGMKQRIRDTVQLEADLEAVRMKRLEI